MGNSNTQDFINDVSSNEKKNTLNKIKLTIADDIQKFELIKINIKTLLDSEKKIINDIPTNIFFEKINCENEIEKESKGIIVIKKKITKIEENKKILIDELMEIEKIIISKIQIIKKLEEELTAMFLKQEQEDEDELKDIYNIEIEKNINIEEQTQIEKDRMEKEQSNEICLVAIKQDDNALKYVIKQNEVQEKEETSSKESIIDRKKRKKQKRFDEDFPYDKFVKNGKMFYFKGCEQIPLSINCVICDKQRFTKEEIQILSNEKLTCKEFNDKFDFRFVFPQICEKYDCILRLDYILLNNNDQDKSDYIFLNNDSGLYDFNMIWLAMTFKDTI